MTKKDLVESLYHQQRKRGFAKVALQDFVDSLIDQMSYILKRHKKLTHPRIGVFKVVKKPARIANHPQTGEKLSIPPRKRIVYKPSLHVKRCLQTPIAKSKV